MGNDILTQPAAGSQQDGRRQVGFPAIMNLLIRSPEYDRVVYIIKIGIQVSIVLPGFLKLPTIINSIILRIMGIYKEVNSRTVFLPGKAVYGRCLLETDKIRTVLFAL